MALYLVPKLQFEVRRSHAADSHGAFAHERRHCDHDCESFEGETIRARGEIVRAVLSQPE